MAHKRRNIQLHHAVFCPKWRKTWLTGSIAADCERLIYRIAALKGFQVVALAILPDHVHILIQTDEGYLFNIPRIMHNIKWFTSIWLRKRHAHLRPHKAFWAVHYWSRSVSAPALKGTLERKDAASVLRYIHTQFEKSA